MASLTLGNHHMFDKISIMSIVSERIRGECRPRYEQEVWIKMDRPDQLRLQGDLARLDSNASGLTRRRFIGMAGALGASSIGVLALAEILAACSGSQGTGPAKSGGHITFGYRQDLRTLNPLLAVDAVNIAVCRLLFDPLVDLDASGLPIPALAAGLPKYSADGSQLTFRLRPGIRWSDGKPLTADDVAWTYSLTYDPNYADFPYTNRGTAGKFIASVTAPDPSTVVMTTNGVYAPALATFGTLGILPKHVLGNLTAKELSSASFNQAPEATSGIFRFKEWVKDDHMTLTRNSGHYSGASLLDDFVYRPVSGPILQSLQTGEVDIGMVDGADVAAARASADLLVKIVDTATTFFMALNLDPAKSPSRFFGDTRVRQALMYALDRKKIADAIGFGIATVPDSMIPSSSWAYVRPSTLYAFDVPRANQLLDDAGWPKNASGIREKDGRPLSFGIMTYGGFAPEESLAQALQAQWKAVGVVANPQSTEGSGYVNSMLQTRDFQVIAAAAVLGSRADPDLSSLVSSSQTGPGGQNYAHYVKPEVDDLLTKAASTVDHDKRRQYYATLQEILATDLPLLPMFATPTVLVLNKRVQGANPSPHSVYNDWYWMDKVGVSDGK